jgi:hypothetical protein
VLRCASTCFVQAAVAADSVQACRTAADSAHGVLQLHTAQHARCHCSTTRAVLLKDPACMRIGELSRDFSLLSDALRQQCPLHTC